MITAQKITEIVSGQLYGDKNLVVKGVSNLIPGKEFCISFLDSNKTSFDLESTNSDLIIISQNFDYSKTSKSVIIARDPKQSFFQVVKKYFYNDDFYCDQTINKTSFISSKAIIHDNVYIGPNSLIEEGAIIKSGVRLGYNCFIGKNTIIDKNSTLYPNTTIYKNVLIGSNVKINSGSVIGAHGFGILKEDNMLVQVPHIGKVIIGDSVILGAGCTVDRGTISDTIVGDGTKVDGQVHIAHNVRIGKNCIISGQVAIGGSTILGDNVVLGGQVGIIDNLKIGNNCKIAAKSAVMKSLEDGSIVSGIPAIEHSKKRRLDVLYYKLPELFKKIKKI